MEKSGHTSITGLVNRSVIDEGQRVTFVLGSGPAMEQFAFSCPSSALGEIIRELQVLATLAAAARSAAGHGAPTVERMYGPTVDVTSFRFAAEANGKSLRLQVMNKQGQMADIEFPADLAKELPAATKSNVAQMMANAVPRRRH